MSRKTHPAARALSGLLRLVKLLGERIECFFKSFGVGLDGGLHLA